MANPRSTAMGEMSGVQVLPPPVPMWIVHGSPDGLVYTPILYLVYEPDERMTWEMGAFAERAERTDKRMSDYLERQDIAYFKVRYITAGSLGRADRLPSPYPSVPENARQIPGEWRDSDVPILGFQMGEKDSEVFLPAWEAWRAWTAKRNERRAKNRVKKAVDG